MARCAAQSIVIATLLVSGCDLKLPNSTGEIKWLPLVGALEATVLKYPKRGIVIVFGTEAEELSRKNRKQLAKISGRLPNVVFIYADASEANSAAAQILREQGLKAPANLLYKVDAGSWDILPEIIDSSTLKEIFMSASGSNRGVRRVP